MREGLKIFLAFLGIVVLFVIAIIVLTESPRLIERINYGESSRSFCQNQDGSFISNLLNPDSCFIGGEEYSIYLDFEEREWRLAK